MANHLFLAATPLNVLTAAMVAFELPEGDIAELGLIKQTNTSAKLYTTLLQWRSSPFTNLSILSEKIPKKNKLLQHLTNRQLIKYTLSQLQPNFIYTSNDSHVEFQFAMMHSKAEGIYLDNGTHSYLNQKIYQLKDQAFNNFTKKMIYGWKWKPLKTLGSSTWINRAIVAFPHLAIPEIRRKGCQKLPENLDRAELQELAALRLTEQQSNLLKSLDTLYLLPHNLEIDSQQNSDKNNIAYKYHSCTKRKDNIINKSHNFELLSKQAIEIPSSIPIKDLLLLLPKGCKLLSQSPNEILTAKSLRPDLQIFTTTKNNDSRAWLNLLTALDINVINDDANPEILKLSHNLLIGTGRDRICYRHPENPDLCIKVSPRDSKQSDNEVRYYHHLKRRNINSPYVAQYFGTIETNLGKGEIFELIKDDDGNISESIKHHIDTKNITLTEAKKMIQVIYDDFKCHRILTRDMSGTNIVIRKQNGKNYPVLIDGLGDGMLIWRHHFNFLVEKKLKQECSKIIKRIS